MAHVTPNFEYRCDVSGLVPCFCRKRSYKISHGNKRSRRKQIDCCSDSHQLSGLVRGRMCYRSHWTCRKMALSSEENIGFGGRWGRELEEAKDWCQPISLKIHYWRLQSGTRSQSSMDPVYHDVSAVRCSISVSGGWEFGNRWCSGDEGVWERGTKHVIHNVVNSRFCLKWFRIHSILILIGKQQQKVSDMKTD